MEECIGNFLFAGICCVVLVISVICAGKFTCLGGHCKFFVLHKTTELYLGGLCKLLCCTKPHSCVAQNHMNVLGHCNLLCGLCNL